MKILFERETKQFDLESVLMEVANYLTKDCTDYIVELEEDEAFDLPAGTYEPISYVVGYSHSADQFFVTPEYENEAANGMWFYEDYIGHPYDFYNDPFEITEIEL